MLDTVKNAPVNGLDLAALGEVVEAIEKDASKAMVGFDVTTRWNGQTRSETTVDGFTWPASASAAATRSSPTSRASCSAATARPTRRSC